uniref:Uncharacterized protein n=1 Tax=Setaria viridis TaxID=4556 RepID=A0A4U6THQ4_SETVI|nr:hypothetical protein SEVIR_8G104033v2 [Setaria viridis]
MNRQPRSSIGKNSTGRILLLSILHAKCSYIVYYGSGIQLVSTRSQWRTALLDSNDDRVMHGHNHTDRMIGRCTTAWYIAVATLIPLKVLLELARAELTSSVRYLQSRGTQPPSHAASSSLQIQRSSHELLLPRSIEAIGMSAPANATGSPAVSSVSCSHKDGGAACWRFQEMSSYEY